MAKWRIVSLRAPPHSRLHVEEKKETGKNRNRRAYVEVLTPVSDAGTARCAPRGSGFGDISRQTWTLQAPHDDCGKDATSHHPDATRLRWTTIRGCFSNNARNEKPECVRACMCVETSSIVLSKMRVGGASVC